MQKIVLVVASGTYKILSRLGLGRFTHLKIVNNLIVSRITSFRLTQNFIRHHLKSSFDVEGHKMYLTRPFFLVSFGADYEPLETSLVRKVIKTGDVVLDIGAHVGYYTLIFAKLVGQQGKVFAFEPDPVNFNLLKKNIELNGYANIISEQKAISNEAGRIRFYLSPDNVGDHRIYDSHDGRQYTEVDAIRLDDYFSKYGGKIDFIKMDIQGAEAAAIEGMAQLLHNNPNLKIMTEFWPLGLKKFGVAPVDYLKKLLACKFQLYIIDDHNKKIELTDVNKLLAAYNPLDGNHTNLLLIKDETLNCLS